MQTTGNTGAFVKKDVHARKRKPAKEPRIAQKLSEERKFATRGADKTSKHVVRKPPPTLKAVGKKAGKLGLAMYAVSELKDAYDARAEKKKKPKK